jgi:hypothetical protein
MRVLIQIWSESAERAFQFVEVGDALLEIRDMRLIANRSVFYFRFRVVIFSETLTLPAGCFGLRS